MSTVVRLAVPTIAAALLLAGCGKGSDSGAQLADQQATPSSASSTATVGDTVTPSAAPTKAATKPATKPTTSATGGHRVVQKANGYQITLPRGYTQITDKAQLQSAFTAGASALKKSQLPGISQALLNSSVKMLAVSPKTGRVINVVVVAAAGATPDQVGDLRSALRDQTKKLGAKSASIRTVTVDGDPALRVEYTLNLSNHPVPTVQYIALHNDKSYTLTFGPLPSQADESSTVASWKFS